MKMRNKRRKRQNTDEILLAEGILLHTDKIPEAESRIKTLLLKGFLVYLIVMGEIGCFLTSLDISCAWLVIHTGVCLGSVFCSFLYYNHKWQNIGYFLLFFVMLASALWLRRYISSGIFAVGNELSERASVFFGSSARRNYVEQISDRSVTIPVAMCYVGWVASILVNVLISRRMRYAVTGILCAAVLFTPLYLEREPDTLYILMLSAGFLMIWIFRKNGHYRLSMQNRRYQCDQKKQRISYVYAGQTMRHTVFGILAVSFAMICLFGVFLPKNTYDRIRSASAMKAGTMDTMENFALLGIMGLFNQYPNTGGLSSGVLGGVSAIRLDYETDLTVTYAPYSMERLYLKSYTGHNYLPRQNRWDTRRDTWGRSLAEQQDPTQEVYQYMYESGDEMSAKGRMRVMNVAAPFAMYLPYYSAEQDKRVAPGETQEYAFYLSGEKNRLSMPDSIAGSSDSFGLEETAIPEENREVITQFCEEAGLRPGMDLDTAEKKLADYFQDHIPYTIRPGATPYQKDFINYFLTENRKGYCAHFASAAVLIFRYLGKPARYVEGYVIDPSDISEDGTVLSEERYEDYYDGYSPIGETAVVSVDVSDAGAHAWAEVYDGRRGWRVVDVTPASTGMDGSGSGLLQQFFDFLLSDAGSGDAQTSDAAQDMTTQGGGGDRLASIGRYAGGILAGLAVLALLVFLGQLLVRRLIWYRRYCAADFSDRLIMRYHIYIRQQGRRIRRRNSGMASPLNYREQLQWLVSLGIWQPEEQELERAVSILERAGFSNTPITEEELAWMLERLKRKRSVSR